MTSTNVHAYRPHFARHLHNLAISGFYARDLDADDHAFLEYVRCHGSANGTLVGVDSVTLEEMEFWQHPYTVEPGVIRKAAGVITSSGEPETLETRRLRTAARRERQALQAAKQLAAAERRAQRAADGQEALAELERERKAHEAAERKKELRRIISDHEWELFGPKRFDVDAEDRVRAQRAAHARKEAEKELKAARAELERHEREQQIRQEVAERAQEAIAEEAQRKEKLDQKLRDAHGKFLHKAAQQLALQRATAEQRRADEAAEQRKAQAKRHSYDIFEVRAAKNSIKALMRNSFPTVWTPERLTSALGLTDVTFIVHCAEEMVRDGELGTAKRVRVPG